MNRQKPSWQTMAAKNPATIRCRKEIRRRAVRRRGSSTLLRKCQKREKSRPWKHEKTGLPVEKKAEIAKTEATSICFERGKGGKKFSGRARGRGRNLIKRFGQ